MRLTVNPPPGETPPAAAPAPGCQASSEERRSAQWFAANREAQDRGAIPSPGGSAEAAAAAAPAIARPTEMLPEGGDEVLDKTEAIVSKLLFHMGLQAQVSAHYGEPREDRRPIMVDVRGSDLGILIGRRGQTLDAFQYVSALMVGKQSGQFIQLIVDVEGHRDRREQQLRQLAQRMAEQVLKTGRKLTLEPMRASERRIIHIELRDHPAVMTESVGEDPYRKVTIIPKE